MALSYKTSGVNIDIANKTKKEMASSLKTDDKRVLNKIGAFASLYNIRFPEYKEPVLVLKTEEPGSKQLLAFKHDRIESLCQDMINHLINDCIVMGAKPLSVQDAIICGKMEKDKIKRIVKGVADACNAQECVLTGGETSEQPGVIPAGTYILTSSIVGIVEKKNIIDGSRISQGDVVLCLESSGIHTNGYSLLRKMLEKDPALSQKKIGTRKFIDIILDPHRCYYKTVKDLFGKNVIKGMAHITGGGIKENLDRILPKEVSAEIDLDAYQILPIFQAIKEHSGISDEDMLRTFNMGVGLAMVVGKADVSRVKAVILKKKVKCYEIGTIVKGNKTVRTVGKLRWV